MTTSTSILVTGNTYPVRDKLRALGGRWDAAAKGWRVPVGRAIEAQGLVTRAPRAAVSARAFGSGSFGSGSRFSGARRTGCSCGSLEGQIRDSDCWTCKHDAE